MDIRAKIQELVEEITAGSELYIVEIKGTVGKKANKISILLDSDTGISIDECAAVSRKLGQKLEEQNLIDTAYTLEVSSPGVDEPLKLARQYTKNIGRDLQVMLNDNSQKKGKLEEVKPDSIVLLIEDKKKKQSQALEIPFTDIKKSNVIVSFK
jgi:ribosome maturation factor RimP